jgi:predicted MFS family arabinose efflux permease
MLLWIVELIGDVAAGELGAAAGRAADARHRRLTAEQIRRRIVAYACALAVSVGAIAGSMVMSSRSGAMYLFLGGLAAAAVGLSALLTYRRRGRIASRLSSNER